MFAFSQKTIKGHLTVPMHPLSLSLEGVVLCSTNVECLCSVAPSPLYLDVLTQAFTMASVRVCSVTPTAPFQKVVCSVAPAPFSAVAPSSHPSSAMASSTVSVVPASRLGPAETAQHTTLRRGGAETDRR